MGFPRQAHRSGGSVDDKVDGNCDVGRGGGDPSLRPRVGETYRAGRSNTRIVTKMVLYRLHWKLGYVNSSGKRDTYVLLRLIWPKRKESAVRFQHNKLNGMIRRRIALSRRTYHP